MADRTSKNRPILYLARAACIAALYAVLTLCLAPISYGVLQFRVSEALCLLPLVFPEAIVGLGIGCLLANLGSPFGVLDFALGSLVTLTAALLTRLLKKPILAGIPPVVLNAMFLPAIWILAGDNSAYLITAASIFVSQSVVIYGLGLPLALTLKKRFGKTL